MGASGRFVFSCRFSVLGCHWPARNLQSCRFLQQLFHSCPAFARRLFGCTPVMPVGFEAHGKVIAVPLEGFELSDPVDHASTHGSPIKPLAFLPCVCTVAVSDAVFGQEIVAVWKWNLAAGGGIAGIPVQHE